MNTFGEIDELLEAWRIVKNLKYTVYDAWKSGKKSMQCVNTPKNLRVSSNPWGVL